MAMDNPSYFTVPKGELFHHNCSNVYNNRRVEKMRSKSSSDTVFSSSISSVNSSPLNSPNKSQSPRAEKREPNVRPNTLPLNEYLVPNGGVSPRSDPNKRSFRSLLRSFSANAAYSQDTQSIILGEPRPTDIAPPNHSAHFSARLNRRPTHSRNTSLKSSAEIKTLELQQNAMRRRNLEFNTRDESFHTMPLSGKRRHSIGAYLSRDKIAGKGLIKVTSVPSQVPKMVAPKVTTDGSAVFMTSVSPGPEKCNPVTTLHVTEPPLPISTINGVGSTSSQRKKRPRGQSMKEMERIVVVSCKESPEAELWADYLISCFNKIMSQKARQHYKVMSMSIESITVEMEDNPKVKHVSTAKLQLLIMCPRLLQHVAELEDASLDILKIFQTDKILTMLLGVTDESILDVHQKAFPSYEQWQRMTVKADDSTFVDSFLVTAVDILSKRQRTPTEKASFSIIPKKIKPGQNRVIALLNEPITNEDVITVRVDKKGEVLDINSFKKRNPYTLQFDVPDCCLEVSMLVWIKIEKNGVPCGSRQIKCESRLRELDQILRASENPLEFMCQTLGFKITDRDQLDNWMLTAFQRNIPPHFNLLSSPLQANMKTNSPSVDEYPSLLHFAARFGLERLCWQLLECPGGEAACDARNVRHLTPADLAQAHGFPDLAAVLRGFVQMSEFSNMYYYLKNMSEEPAEPPPQGSQVKILNTDPTRTSWEKFNSNNLKTTPLNTPDSNRSDPFSEECLQNLEAKHSHRMIKPPESPRVLNSPKNTSGEWLYENDIHPMNASFSSQTSVQKAIEHDYLIQPSNRKVENFVEAPPPCRPQKIELNLHNKPAVTINSPTVEKLPPFTLPPEFFEMKSSFMGCSAPKSKLSSSLSVSSKSSHDHQVTTPTGQDELAEIINDFKKNVFTISEVEKLVMDWRNRNETQQSLKEKQEQLNKMREEYDKLQRRIKDDMKRPTPFERVRKIFSKGKSKNNKNGTPEPKPSGPRPNSGLSIHSVSSSSSGRLSTASGGSLGDSGTQSDNEDIKMFMEMKHIQKATPTSERSMDSSAFDDYLIPPPPRPFISNQTMFTGKNQPLPCIPGMCHTKQEYMIKTPPPMDTITENQIPAHLQEATSDGSHCSQSQNVNNNRFKISNDVSDHQYMNMSPA